MLEDQKGDTGVYLKGPATKSVRFSASPVVVVVFVKMKQILLIFFLLSAVLVATVTALIPKARPGSLGPMAETIIPGAPMDDSDPFLANTFDGGSDYRPLDFGYLPGTTRYMGNRIKGSGYTSLHGLNYESVGYRDDYYTNEAYPQLVGQGQVRVNGQDAELTCQFPPTFDIVSVINQNVSNRI